MWRPQAPPALIIFSTVKGGGLRQALLDPGAGKDPGPPGVCPAPGVMMSSGLRGSSCPNRLHLERRHACHAAAADAKAAQWRVKMSNIVSEAMRRVFWGGLLAAEEQPAT